MSREELLAGLTAEQIARVKACKNQEELLALAKEEGVALTDEQLSAISGGSCFSTQKITCPSCGSENVKEEKGVGREAQAYFECGDCGFWWWKA